MQTIDRGEALRIAAEREQAHGLPDGTLFKMAGIESGLNGNAVSPKGAKGYLQFMDATAKTYGVKVGDFESEADGAARYMKDNLAKYNGSMELALADYNGGPKAAAALARGKPFPETTGYLAKFFGSDHTASAAVIPPASNISKQFTTGESTVPSYGGPSASELSVDAAKRDAEYGGVINGLGNLPDAVVKGFKADNSVYNWWQTRALSNVDENFSWTKDNTEAALKDIPQHNWDFILQAKSEKEAEARRARVIDSLEQSDQLGKMGAAGLTGRLVGGLADLPTLLAFVPGAGEAAFLSKTSRMVNAVRSATANAVGNVAFDAATMKYRPLAEPEDLYASAAMGLGLGGLTGGLHKPGGRAALLSEDNHALGKYGMREGLQAHADELKAAEVPVPSHVTETIAKMDERTPRVEPEVAAVRGETAAIPKASEPIPVMEQMSTTVGREMKGEVSSAREALTRMAESEDPLVRGLAPHLLSNLPNDVRIITVEKSKLVDGYRPAYDMENHVIYKAADTPDNVVLHEIAHAATAHKIEYGLANPDTMHGQLASQLNDVLTTAREAAVSEKLSSDARYYLSNIHEFVAGLYSGKSDFIDFLAKVKVADGGDTVLGKIVDTVRKLLGMAPDEANALTQAMGLSDKIAGTKLAVTMQKWDGVNMALGEVLPGSRSFKLAPASASVDSATVGAANHADIPEVFGWGLALENRLGGAKAPAAVRELASKLFGTTVGYKNHSVVKGNAWDDTTKLAESWAVDLRKEAYPAFEEEFKASGRKFHEKGQAFEEFGEAVSRYVRGFEGEFSPQVKRAGDKLRDTMANVVDYINNPLKDEGRIKRGLTETEVRLEDGSTELVGALEKNPNYLPRKHDVNKWNDMVDTFGRPAVEGWWARAYQAGRQDISDEAAGRFAKWYVRTIEEAHANRSSDLLEDMMRGGDRDALKESLKLNGGYTEAEALRVMDDMLPTKPTDAGRVSSSLKHRNSISETYAETWTRADGTKQEVTLHDFIHANAFDVAEPYLRRTAGNVALAKHLDIYRVSDIDKAILEATTNKLGEGFTARAKVADYRKNLKFAFDRIQAIPQEEFSTLNKSLSMWRDFNVIRLMGGAVWNQAVELSQIVGSMGWKTTLEALPELKALKRDIATGKAPHDVLDHLENTIGGVGSEYVARMDFSAKDDWVRNKGDTKFNRWLDTADTASKKVAKGVLDYTGMTPLMIQQKRVHAVALVNHFVNVAHGKLESKLLTDARKAWMGFGEGEFDAVMAAIRNHTKPADGEFSKTFKMDFAGWVKDSPETHSKFMNAVHRETRRVVQENDLASMVPIMGNTWGKTLFQFMNFSMHGWNKSLMFAANHRDWSTLSTVLHGGLFAAMAYMGRTLLTAQGMDAEKKQAFLEQRMSARQIVANSFGRVSQASLLPNLFDTVSPVPMFAGMRTTSDLSSLASNPTYSALNTLISMKKILRNAASDEYQTTSGDVKAWGKLVPLNNVLPISTLLNHIANDFPSQEQVE